MQTFRVYKHVLIACGSREKSKEKVEKGRRGSVEQEWQVAQDRGEGERRQREGVSVFVCEAWSVVVVCSLCGDGGVLVSGRLAGVLCRHSSPDCGVRSHRPPVSPESMFPSTC